MIYDTAGAIHMHSDYSHDGLDSLESLRDACISRSIRWVGMTDHAEDLDPDIFEEYKANCAALSDDILTFIPGLEFRFAGFRGVHLFAVGLTHWIQPRTFAEFFDQTSDAECFTVLAHPVLCRYVVPQIVLDRIDAIEIWNTNYNTRYLADPRAIALYHGLHVMRPTVVATVGLDQHDSRNDRGVRTLISADDIRDPVAALKSGRFTTIGRDASFDSSATMTESAMRALRLKRYTLDIVNKLHDRLMFGVRRLGVDP
ncbi:MAG: PHP domain-containing protein [Gemmatimonadaceae bacterium]